MSDVVCTVAGAQVSVQRQGPLGAPTLVLMHGVGGSHHAFDALLPFLDGIDVLVPSQPGHPGSGGAVLSDAAAVAQWTETLLSTMKIDSAFVGGHSYGGGVALELALRGLFKVRGLTLMATGARLRVRADIVEACRMASEEARDDPTNIAHAIHADWVACNKFDRLEAVKKLTLPTLVLSGENDVFIPRKFVQYLADSIAGARWEAFSDAGHDLPSEQPQRVGKAISDFVRLSS